MDAVSGLFDDVEEAVSVELVLLMLPLVEVPLLLLPEGNFLDEFLAIDCVMSHVAGDVGVILLLAGVAVFTDALLGDSQLRGD